MIKKINKSNYLKDLILLISIPVGVIILVAAVVYIPKIIANPKYDFIYSVCDNYLCNNDYVIDNSGYVSESKNNSDSELNSSYLRYFDTQSDSYSSISLQELSNYHLISSSKSPDGYSLSKDESVNSSLMFRNSDNQWYLKNGLLNKKVELTNGEYYYYDNIKFIGWVEKNEN